MSLHRTISQTLLVTKLSTRKEAGVVPLIWVRKQKEVLTALRPLR